MQKITLDGFVRKAITPFRIAIAVDENTSPWRFGKSPIFEPFLISLIESFNPEYRIGPFRMAVGVKIDTYVWEKPQITVAGPTCTLRGRLDINASNLFMVNTENEGRLFRFSHASIAKFSWLKKSMVTDLPAVIDIVSTWVLARPFAGSIQRCWIDYDYMDLEEILEAITTARFLDAPWNEILKQFLMRLKKLGIKRWRQYYRWDNGFKNFYAKNEVLADALATELGPPPYTASQLMLA